MAKGDTRGTHDFYSGRLNERDVLGEFRGTSEYGAAFREAANERGYVTYDRAMELVRRYSSEDPLNPKKPFARELRLAVLDELGFEEDADTDRVKFYSAVGTPLDVFHGVDAWIELVTQRGRRHAVTLDVTMNPGKETHKADVIVQAIPDPSEDEKGFLDAVYQIYGPEVAQRLRDAEIQKSA
ncbi:hypothetical protein HY631_02765 [Candidatus Uhrbacteria bacterium]|nr:hypothetical protein [Candidatus Uhrbacteria bacterium]